MYTSKITRLPKNTVEIQIILDKKTVKQEYSSAFQRILQNFESPGFRKGKVPEKIAEKQIKKDTVYEELIRKSVPEIYGEIVKKDNLKPILSPKIELVKAKEHEDWEIKITLAEKPLVDLGSYKEVIKKAKAEQKKEDIWVPGKSAQPGNREPSEQEKAKKQQQSLNLVLSALIKSTKCEISDLIVEEELNQRLSNLLTDIQKIGLTVDSYLKSKNLTQDVLKKTYRQEIEQTYKLEFVLAEIADKENIKIENSDLDKVFASISDLKEKEAAKANSYFYASVLRKQKTLDYLLTL